MSTTEMGYSKASAYSRKYRYGITPEKFDSLLVEQDNACAVCRTDFTEAVRPNVDHDHNCCQQTKSCGRCLRGLLCSNCLTLASIMETRFAFMDDMFRYLTKYLISEVK